MGDLIAKPLPDILDPTSPAGILAGIVQKGTNCLGLVGTVFERNAGYPEQMRQVGDFRPFSRLAGMDYDSVLESIVELW